MSIGDDRVATTQGVDYTFAAIAPVYTGDPCVAALLTLKNLLTDADPGVLQKLVITTYAAGVGQVVDDGSVTGLAAAQFSVTAADVTALAPRDFFFSVKFTTANGDALYAARGLWRNSQP